MKYLIRKLKSSIYQFWNEYDLGGHELKYPVYIKVLVVLFFVIAIISYSRGGTELLLTSIIIPGLISVFVTILVFKLF